VLNFVYDIALWTPEREKPSGRLIGFNYEIEPNGQQANQPDDQYSENVKKVFQFESPSLSPATPIPLRFARFIYSSTERAL